MLIRRKRSRVEAFPQEIVIEEGEKKAKCNIVASGLKADDFNPFLRDLVIKREQKQSKNGALNRARQQNSIIRDDARINALRSLRETRVLQLDSPSTGNISFDLDMDRALFQAFQTNNFIDVFRLLDEGRFVDIVRPADGTTALMAACFHGNLDVAQKLLERGADPEHQDKFGNTPLSFADNVQNVEVRKRLVDMLKAFEFVIDIYEIDSGFEAGTGGLPRFTTNSSGMLHFDELSGQFVEMIHDVNDADFGRFGDEDSDSNSEGYYERHMEDEDDVHTDDDYDYDDSRGVNACKIDRQYYKYKQEENERGADFEFE